MATSNVVLGEMTHAAVGGQLAVVGVFDAGRKTAPKAVGERKFPATFERKRPCCKTCAGKACTGHCRF